MISLNRVLLSNTRIDCTIILIEAEKVAEVAQIQFNQKVMEKEKEKEMSRIEDETKVAQQIAEADSAFYTSQKQSESNKVCY